MSRPPRGDTEGGIYHVLNRGNHREPIFDSPYDYFDFLDVMREVKRNLPFILHAFCLMPNHFHLLIQRLTTSLSTILQRIQGTYAMRLNRRRNQTGHVFQDRFKEISCESDAQYQTVIRYIHQNPIRAGLVARPENWDWSSHNAYASIHGATYGIVDASIGLTLLGPNETSARINYKNLMGKDLSKEDLDFVRNAINSNQQAVVETTKIQPELLRRDFGTLIRAFCDGIDVSAEEIVGPSRAHFLTPIRTRLTQIALREGFSVSQIAAHLNRTSGAISRLTHKSQTTGGQTPL